MYGKVFESIYDGTLHGHWQAIVTMQQLIVLANEDGVVDLIPEAISRRTSIPLEIIKAGLEHLEEPDPHSRSPEEGGRRIVRIDAHRPWGWKLVNYEKYRDLRNREQKRVADRDRMAAARRGEHQARKGYVYFASAGKDGSIKIGYSANPWARLNDLQNGSPKKYVLLAVMPGSDADERSLHAEFGELRIHGEWFKRSQRLLQRIKEINDRSAATGSYAATVAHTDADADIEEEGKDEAGLLPGVAAPEKNGHNTLQTRELRKHALELLTFLNEKASRNYQPLAVNVDMIVARLRDGATVADCRAVIAKKCREWLGDAKMNEYLRPATLFNRTKFAQYQGELVVKAAA